jgi:hypothetical protein
MWENGFGSTKLKNKIRRILDREGPEDYNKSQRHYSRGK